MRKSNGSKRDDNSLLSSNSKLLLVSFPKSGRTWLRFAIGLAKIDVEVCHACGALGKRVIGKQYQDIPAELHARSVVLLHRNPIDTAVSFYYQTTRRVLPRGSWRWFSEWLPLALRGRLPPRSIDAFVLSPLYGVQKICAFNRLWLDHVQARGDCLVLNCEDMRADSAAGFPRLLDYWGEASVSGAQLAEMSSVEKMRAAEKGGQRLGRPDANRSFQRNLQYPSSAKVRRAVVNG